MHTCTHCGGFVTSDFVRVFGAEENVVHGCPGCTSLRELMRGRGAYPRETPLPARGEEDVAGSAIR
jgi:hypothetical protein